MSEAKSEGLFLQTLERWRRHPELFVRECLGVEPVAWQEKALRALADNDRIAIRSGHGVGKSAYLSWVILWFLLTRYPAKVACTAPSGHQLEDVLWSEIARWHRKMPEGVKRLLDVGKDSVTLTAAPKESFAVARTARKDSPEAFQGFHSDNMLFIADEASGIDDIIFEVGEGAMSTPGAMTVMTGNPTRNTGYFYRAFHQMRHRWWCLRVSSEEVAGDHVSAQMAADYEAAYGRDSNVFRVRVMGEFPTADEDAIVPLHLIEAAVARDVKPTGMVVWGVDVARFGDDRSTLCKRRGNTILEPVKAWRQLDNMQVAGRVVQEWTDTDERPDWILVDSIGYGAGVVDRLKEMGLPVRGVNVAEVPSVADQYMRLRDELWFRMREWFEQRDCSMPRDDALIAEIASMKFHPPTSNGKTKVWSKQELKKAGMPSPDLAEAFLMTFAAPARPSVWTQPIHYGPQHASRGVV